MAYFVIALVRRGRGSRSLSVEGLASEETLKIIEVDFDALDDAWGISTRSSAALAGAKSGDGSAV